MPFASTCACGRSTDSFGGLCDRCVALKTLELPTTATAAQIENSYRTLVKVWHPDRFQTDLKLRLSAEEKLKEINAAHDYLISEPAQEPPNAQPRPKPPSPTQDQVNYAPEPTVEQGEPEASGFESTEVQRILKRRRQRFSSLPKILLQAGFAAGTVATVAILWLVIDGILMSNPKTAGTWDQYKTQFGRDLHANSLRLWTNATDNLHGQKNEGAAPVASQPQAPPTAAQPPAIAPSAAAGPARPVAPGLTKVEDSPQTAQPYVTSGLTPMEVLTILGTPTSSSGEKMFYKGSEIDFKNGRVAGWKVDLSSSPIRVKLWPSTAPEPGLTRFAVGSSKSDVIALQGTPTLFSDNKFGYGNSVVFFQADRVAGWQEDPNSVRLRVAH